jgi:hypothetical protein
MELPPAKRYKKRDEERKDLSLVGHASTRYIALTARHIKDSEESAELKTPDKSTITGYEKKKFIAGMRNDLLRRFMDTYQVYYTVHIVVDSGADMEVLLIDHAKLDKLCELLLSAAGIDNYEVRVHIEDEDREELCKSLPLNTIYHIDDLDFWVDELITKHDVIFHFQEDASGFFESIQNKTTKDVSNLEMQYLRQFAAGVNRK